MSQAWMRKLAAAGLIGLAWMAIAQKPGDTMFSLDPGGRGYGMGGAFVAIADDVTATAWNPAGLAYLTRPEFQLVFKNMPSYTTQEAGTAQSPFTLTSGSAGSQQPGFVGLALPMKGATGFARGGVMSIAFWRGGFYENDVTANTLTSGDPDSTLEITNKSEATRLATDFYGLSYAFALSNGLKLGVSAMYAQASFDYSLFYNIVDSQNPGTILGTVDQAYSEAGTGFGGQVGLIGPIGDLGNWGVSYRTEFKLHDFGAGAAFADTIPARLSFGASYRLSDVSRGASKDYLVGSVEFDHYFSANSGLTAERKEITNMGAGIQYTLAQSRFSLPVRLGVRSNQAGSSLFSNESILTFGLGYRPLNDRWSVDFDFGKSNRHTGLDFSLSLGWQFGQD